MGLSLYCRICSRVKSNETYKKNLIVNRERKRLHAVKNSEAAKERSRAWYENNKQRTSENVKSYREQNSEWVKWYQKTWASANRDKRRSSYKKWGQSEKGKTSISSRNSRRKARLRGATGSHSANEWNELKQNCNYTCNMCNTKEPDIKLTRDHIITVSKGGSDSIENIQPLCGSCNSKKKDKIMKASMKLSEATIIASNIVDQLSPFCERIQVAGSIRRGKSLIGDVEIVCVTKKIPKTQHPVFEFIDIVNSWKKIRGLPTGKMTTRLLPEGINLDLFMVPWTNFGYHVAVRTGSADYSKRVLAGGWVANGYHSVEGFINDAEGNAIYCPEEEDLFRLAGVKYIEPRFRHY